MVSYDMPFTTLISTAALALHMDDPAYAIIDCRYKLDDASWGEREHAAAHIPGAIYADLGRDLAGPRNGTNGRHPLPDPHVLAQTFSRLGIASGVQAVAYDQENGMYASRLWWLLRWLGHDAAAVLDGGFAKWKAEGRPTRSGVEHREPCEFSGSPRADMSVGVDQVASQVGRSGWRLVDARAPERYRGDTEPIDKTPGHIPGAANHFFQWNLDEQGLFRTPEALRARVKESLGEVSADRLVCYCGSGVTACHNLLALEHAGLKGAKLYAGSWSEWSSDPARPVEKG
jgi:thiosulfate/3-mercaptopyruvate sulfurtransferase